MSYTLVMVCHIVCLAFRPYLTALHYNENAGCPQATSAVGEPLFKVTFPKGEYRVGEVKTLPTFSMYFFLYFLLYKSV